MGERLKSSRLVQALVVYVGAAWVLLQITETLQGLLGLPAWVGPVEVVFLLLGMVVVLATAWVQSLPQTTAKEEAGEVPTDWEVAPADVLANLKAGRLPHLTWGRAALAVLVALSLLFGSAGLYVLVRGPVGMMGPQEAGAEAAAAGIAVLPFHVTGEGLDVYREGMVDLMAANLDGLSNFRAIDARTLLSRWNRDIGETADAELDAALRVAAGTGARYAVVGSGVEAGERIRFNAQTYDLSDGSRIGEAAQVEGPPDEVLALVDALTVGVVRSVLEATGMPSSAQTFRLASVLTESVPALRHYLEGDAAYRRMRFNDAQASFQRAIENDSTFALAYWKLGEALGWATDISNEESFAAKRRAQALGHRLPEREATLLDIGFAIADETLGPQMDRLRSHLRQYPDDPDGWYYLVEGGLHVTRPTGITDADVERALRRTVALDPDFAPYYRHALEWAGARGEDAWFRELMAGARLAAPDDGTWDIIQAFFDLLWGDEETRAATAARVSTMDLEAAATAGSLFVALADHNLDRLEPLLSVEDGGAGWRMSWLVAQGRLAEAMGQLEQEGSALFGSVVVSSLLPEWYHMGGVSQDQIRAAYEATGRGTDPLSGWAKLVLSASLSGEAAASPFHEELSRFEEEIWKTVGPGADTATAQRQIGAMGQILEAERMAVAGDPAGALERFRGSLDDAPSGLRQALFMWEGRFAAMAGDWRAAVPLLEAQRLHPWTRTTAMYWLGKGYDATGDPEQALEAYRTFLSRTSSADPGLAPVEEARQAVARLGG